MLLQFLHRLYSKKNQVEVFKEELNGNALADGSDIIDVSKGSSDWFAKGHLSPGNILLRYSGDEMRSKIFK